VISDPIFTSWEYAIGGKMIVGRAEMDESFRMIVEHGPQQAVMMIKEKLTRDMVHFIMENKLVEFTHHDDPITLRRQLAVRAYLAPNDQVRILRLAKQL
jgi:hypothetical protein